MCLVGQEELPGQLNAERRLVDGQMMNKDKPIAIRLLQYKLTETSRAEVESIYSQDTLIDDTAMYQLYCRHCVIISEKPRVLKLKVLGHKTH